MSRSQFSNVILDSLNTGHDDDARHRHNIQEREKQKRALAVSAGVDYDAELAAEYAAMHHGGHLNPEFGKDDIGEVLANFWNNWHKVITMYLITFFYYLIGVVFYTKMERVGGDPTAPNWTVCKYI